MILFKAGPKKMEITRSLDLDLLKKTFGTKRCHYCGLTGAYSEDVKIWSPFIKSIDAVEKYKEPFEQIHSTYARDPVLKSFSTDLRIIFGDIDEIILENEKKLRFPIDLINLDYYGMAFPNESNKEPDELPRRLKAINKFIMIQKSCIVNHEPFVLFLTIQGQRSNSKLILELLTQANDAIDGSKNNKEDIFKYLSQNIKKIQYERLIVIIPILIIIQGYKMSFETKCELIAIYKDNVDKFLHFGFVFRKYEKTINLLKTEHLIPIPIQEIRGFNEEGKLTNIRTGIPPFQSLD